MDPSPIGPVEWSQIGTVLSTLWLVVLFVVLFAANMILGHNVIPSGVASGHFPESTQKLRIVLYVLALVSFGLAMFFLSQVAGDANTVLRRFYQDFWI